MRSWASLRELYGEQLTGDLYAIGFDPENMQARGNSADMGWRRYATWLTINASGPSQALGVLRKPLEGFTDGALLTLLAESVQAWIDEMAADNSLSNWTVRNYGLQTVRALIDLSALPDRAYPKITRAMVRLPKVDNTAKSLGELGFIEIDSHAGVTREKAARDIVLGIAQREFYRLHGLFEFGRDLLADNSSALPVDSPRALLANCVRFEQLCWQKFAMSQFDRRAPPLVEAAGLAPHIPSSHIMYRMSDNEFWIAAGVTEATLPATGSGRYAKRLMPEAIYSLILSLCGPTARASAMIRTWLACMTGWNRKQVIFLRRHPVVLRTESSVGLSNMTFFEEFKGRAGHNVMTAIEDGSILRGGMAEKALDAWHKAGGAMAKDEAWRLESPGASIIKALDDYDTMANAVRRFDAKATCEKYFFVSLTRNDGLSLHSKMELSHFKDVFPKGTNFQAIRKSVQLIEYNRVGSVAAQITGAGHKNTSILMKHYLTTQDFRDDLDAKIRFFQNCLVSNIAVTGGFEHKLDIPLAFIKWFYNFSRLCGLQVVARTHNPTKTLYSVQVKFTVDPHTLEELYLSHLSLRKDFHRHERRRWLIQGVGQLAAVKFFGRKMIAHTGLSEYFAAARRVSKELRAGKITLISMIE